jgi:hypothetical protein
VGCIFAAHSQLNGAIARVAIDLFLKEADFNYGNRLLYSK